MPATDTPIGLAILVCDRVIIEHKTQNKTIVSTFNAITSAGFPARHDKLCLYLALTNSSGRRQIEIKCVQGSEPVFAFSFEIEFQDPNQVCEVIYTLKNVIFPRPGLYSFEVWSGGEYIFEGRVTLVNTIENQP